MLSIEKKYDHKVPIISGKRRFVNIFLTLVVLSLPLWGLYIHKAYQQWQLRKAIVNIENKGLPASLASLRLLYPEIPADDNGALIVLGMTDDFSRWPVRCIDPNYIELFNDDVDVCDIDGNYSVGMANDETRDGGFGGFGGGFDAHDSFGFFSDSEIDETIEESEARHFNRLKIWRHKNRALLPFIGGAKIPENGELIDPLIQAAIESFFDENKGQYSTLKALLNYEHSSVTLDFFMNQHAATINNEEGLLGKFIILRNILRAKVYRDVAAADFNALLEGFELQLKLIDAFKDVPLFVAQIFCSMSQGAFIDSLEYALNTISFDKGSLNLLAHTLSKWVNHNALGISVTGELALQMNALIQADENSEMEKTNARDSSFMEKVYLFTGFAQKDARYLIEINLKVIESLNELPLKRLQILAGIRQKAESLPSYRMVRHVGKFFQQNEQRFLALHVRSELMRIVIAIEQYRLVNNKLPKNLAVLNPAYLPAVPIDDYSEKPFRYICRSELYKVYSVGKDGVDNRGKVKDHNGQKYSNGTDIVFIGNN